MCLIKFACSLNYISPAGQKMTALKPVYDYRHGILFPEIGNRNHNNS